MKKQQYTQSEALREVFQSANPTQHGKQLYDKVKIYESRYQNGKGKLGQKAIDSLLEAFGFEKEVSYIKKENL